MPKQLSCFLVTGWEIRTLFHGAFLAQLSIMCGSQGHGDVARTYSLTPEQLDELREALDRAARKLDVAAGPSVLNCET